MQALMVIALMCQVHVGLSSLTNVDQYQKDCQKKLVACYESKFPKAAPSDSEWVGGLKDCVKAR